MKHINDFTKHNEGLFDIFKKKKQEDEEEKLYTQLKVQWYVGNKHSDLYDFLENHEREDFPRGLLDKIKKYLTTYEYIKKKPTQLDANMKHGLPVNNIFDNDKHTLHYRDRGNREVEDNNSYATIEEKRYPSSTDFKMHIFSFSDDWFIVEVGYINNSYSSAYYKCDTRKGVMQIVSVFNQLEKDCKIRMGYSMSRIDDIQVPLGGTPIDKIDPTKYKHLLKD